MNSQKNILLYDRYGRPIATDIFYEETGKPKPVVIYSHGFNGFKDWGNFDLIAKQFATAGFTFIKFNFSFNGTTPEHPEEFVDLDAYAENNYTKELDNLGAVIDWTVDTANHYANEIDAAQIFLLGHSLGGGISLLKAAEDERVKKVVTWASVSECKTPWTTWPSERIAQWKEAEVEYITNSRTKQEMPLDYQLYEDYQDHKARLDIEVAIKKLHIPVLLCHGLSDPAVPIAKAHLLKEWQSSATLFTIESDHVFGRKHPWTESHLPEAMQSVVDRSIEFLN